jgi:hypothetical protein
MILANGDGTYTVRFYENNGRPNYVTVNDMLPVDSNGDLVYADCGCATADVSMPLWIPLVEKAYAQWNATGQEGRDGKNDYNSLNYGWMNNVYSQVLGRPAGCYCPVTAGDKAAFVTDVTNDWAVSVCTLNTDGLSDNLVGNHAYAVIGYDSNAGTFTLYNPWGYDQPTSSLTWSQLQSVCGFLSVANPAGTTPISQVEMQVAATTDNGGLTSALAASPTTVTQQAYILTDFEPDPAAEETGRSQGFAFTERATDQKAEAVNASILPWVQPIGSVPAQAVDAVFRKWTNGVEGGFPHGLGTFTQSLGTNSALAGFSPVPDPLKLCE